MDKPLPLYSSSGTIMGGQSRGSRRLFGVSVVTTISQAAVLAHTLAADAVGVDVDTEGVGLVSSASSNARRQFQ